MIEFWTSLDLRKRVILVLTTVVVFASVLGLSRLVNAPSYSLLYSGLEPAAAGEVVSALEQAGAAYQVRGASIFVDASKRDELRMSLAAQGLPLASGQGYELLDSLSGFGTTAQMFDAAYWRAKEGELARTIQSSPHIQSARVHIANTTTRPFRPAETAAASVTVISKSGALSSENAVAIRYLVASAVAGLTPASVSVIDGRNGAVVGGEEGVLSGSGAADRANELRHNILRLLEARVGVGRAVVEVNVETVTAGESVTERLLDPDSRVPISTETEETSNSASGSGSSAVTVASNLPEGDATGGQQNSNSQGSKTRETINFEISETLREVVRKPGAIKRVSVAVLVDGVEGADPQTGEPTWEPRGDQELNDLRELVSSAMGFDEARGDSLTIKSLQLALPEYSEVVPQISLIERLGLDVMRLIQIAVLSIVAIVLGLFVLRPILTRASEPNLIAAEPEPTVLPPPSSEPQAETSAALANGGGLPELPMMPMHQMAIGNGMPGSDAPQDPVDRLRNLIEERQDEAVQILEGWMNDEEEPA